MASVDWPKTSEEMALRVEEILAEFPGWGNGDDLYSQSVEIAADATLVAFNYIASRLGLSAFQASLVPSKLHARAFKGL